MDKRIRELDILRTSAVFLMVTYHIIFDLWEFMGIGLDYNYTYIMLIGRLSAVLFIFLCGLSSCIGKRNTTKGIKLVACGTVITLVTFIFFRSETIYFGILHLLGVCMVLSSYLKKLPTYLLVVISSIAFLLGAYFDTRYIGTNLLLPFGIAKADFQSFDYYPLIPYISVFIWGIIYYRFFYKDKISIFNIKAKNDIIEKISRNSLKIYLLHQILIVSAIYFFIYAKKLLA